MSTEIDRAAAELRACLGPLVRRLRQVHLDGELTLSQISVLVQLEREGPASPGELARLEDIRPQSMGATVATLADRGLVSRSADPADKRRVVVALTAQGRRALQGVRQQKAKRLARAIGDEFTAAEQAQLVEAIPLLERLSRVV